MDCAAFTKRYFVESWLMKHIETTVLSSLSIDYCKRYFETNCSFSDSSLMSGRHYQRTAGIGLSSPDDRCSDRKS